MKPHRPRPPDLGPGSFATGLQAKTRSRTDTLRRAYDVGHPPGPRNDLLPRLTLVYRDISELKGPVRNVRPSDHAHVREVANAIGRLGFSEPILIDEDGRVIHGMVRLEAARLIGLTKVPCVVANHLSSEERRLLRLTLNRLGEKGRWDLDELKIELGELIIEGMPVEIAFSSPELDQIFLDDPDGYEQGPLEPEEGEPKARLGEVYRLGRHRVACGDARDPDLTARLMGGDTVRLVLTDPPYNVPIQGHVTGQNHREFAMASGEMSPEAFLAFNQAWIETASRYLADGGVLASFIDWRGYPVVHAAATAAGLAPLNLVVWSKTNAGMGSLYRSAHELLPLYKKGQGQHLNNVGLGRHGRWRSNVWTYPGASSLGSDARKGLKTHPTVKPVAMLTDALLDLTGPSDVVLDPFLGSGSTLIAVEKAGRVCRGVEIDPLYVDLILRRYQALTGIAPARVEPPPEMPNPGGSDSSS